MDHATTRPAKTASRPTSPGTRTADQRISVELSRAQVDQVVREAGEAGTLSTLMLGLDRVRERLVERPVQWDDARLSRSLLAGLMLLASLPVDGSYVANALIARGLEMNPSTCHRYVSTLVEVGLLERDPATRRYRLVHLPELPSPGLRPGSPALTDDADHAC
jgi:hypothetical protein